MKTSTTKIALGIISILVIGLTSCSERQPTQDDIVKQNAEEYVKSISSVRLK